MVTTTAPLHICEPEKEAVLRMGDIDQHISALVFTHSLSAQLPSWPQAEKEIVRSSIVIVPSSRIVVLRRSQRIPWPEANSGLGLPVSAQPFTS